MKKRHIYFIISVAILGLFGYQLVSKFLPDFWWFSSVEYSSLWWFYLKAKMTTFTVFFGVAFLFLWLNLYLAKRFSMVSDSPRELRFRTPFSRLNLLLEELALQRHEQSLGRHILFRVLFVVILILAGVLALSASGCE